MDELYLVYSQPLIVDKIWPAIKPILAVDSGLAQMMRFFYCTLRELRIA